MDYRNNERFFQSNKFQPSADGAYIEIMCKAFDTEQHLTVLTPEDLCQTLEDATIARDLPGMADVDFSLLAFCGQIRQDVYKRQRWFRYNKTDELPFLKFF